MKKILNFIFSTFKYKTAYIDIKNKMFIKEQLYKHKKDYMFTKYNLFINWWNHLCVLISLTPDDIEVTEGSLDMEDKIFYDKLNVINSYITNVLLLGDLLIPYVKKIEDSYSYRVIYKHYLKVYSITWVIKNIIFYSILIYFLSICL